MHRMRALFLAALVAAVSPAQAEIYDNKSVPIYLETPAGFTIRPATVAGQDLVLNIDLAAGSPGRTGGEAHLCQLRFEAVAVQQTQDWFNARMKDEALLAQARVPLEEVLTLRSETPFALGDVVGREYVGLSRENPKAVAVVSMIVTPRGRLTMNCMLRAEYADSTLTVVRMIRDSIRPPK